MPSIVGIDLSDGIKILLGKDNNGVDVTPGWYKKAALEAYLTGPPAHTIAQTETFLNGWLTNAIGTGDQVKVHIFSASPLRYTCIVANTGVVIPTNWWE